MLKVVYVATWLLSDVGMVYCLVLIVKKVKHFIMEVY